MIPRTVPLAVALLGAAAIAQEVPPPLPTSQELQRQVDAGEYREALKGLLRVLDLKGPAAAGYDRIAMLLLRAECQLQIRESRAALQTLQSVMNEASAAGNARDLGTALALSTLVGKSPGMIYSPRVRTVPGPLALQPIPILDRAKRPDAFKALFEDELAQLRPAIRAAVAARALAPILEAAKSAAILRALEEAGTGESTRTRELTRDLADRAVWMLDAATLDTSAAVEAAAARANTMGPYPVRRVDPVTGRTWIEQVQQRRGVSNADAQGLRGAQQTCAQVIAAAGDLALAFPDDVARFQDIATAAAAVGQKASAVLSDNYAASPQQTP